MKESSFLTPVPHPENCYRTGTNNTGRARLRVARAALHRVPGFDADGRSSRSRLAALGFRPSKGPGQARAPSPPPYPRPLDARGRRDRRGVRGRGALSIAAPSERRRRDRGAETRQTACPGRTQGRPADAAEPHNPKRKSTRGRSPLDPRGKEVTIQGVSVRATRNPRKLIRLPVTSRLRLAERRYHGSLNQEPPRSTRAAQFPDSHALPSVGAPA